MQMLRFLQLLLIFLASSVLGKKTKKIFKNHSFETTGWKPSKIKAAQVRLLPMFYREHSAARLTLQPFGKYLCRPAGSRAEVSVLPSVQRLRCSFRRRCRCCFANTNSRECARPGFSHIWSPTRFPADVSVPIQLARLHRWYRGYQCKDTSFTHPNR